MKKKNIAAFILALCLTAQLNFCSADNNYDEEITLPIGTNFDLEMEEVTRYEYDGNYVKAQTVNGKEQFILQKEGDTIINVVMDDKGQKTELRVLVHIVSEQKFNNGDKSAAPAQNPTNAKATEPSTAPTTTENKTQPVTTSSPATLPAKVETSQQSAKVDAPTTPAAKESDNKTNQPVATTQTANKSETVAPTTTTKQKEQKPLTAIQTEQTFTRPTASPTNSLESVKYKADQMAFDVLDLVNAERAKYNLRPLSMAKDLQGAASLRSRELTSRFSHTRPDGTKYVTALNNIGKLQGENYAAGQISPSAVVRAWMNSTTHRENILNPEFTELGVGYYETTSATYPVYWVQLFRG